MWEGNSFEDDRSQLFYYFATPSRVLVFFLSWKFTTKVISIGSVPKQSNRAQSLNYYLNQRHESLQDHQCTNHNHIIFILSILTMKDTSFLKASFVPLPQVQWL
ncbi:unnamed protein product [Ixodes pacificus]